MKQLFLFLFLSFFISKGYCCDCDTKPSIKKNWELADQVFIGKVVKVDSLFYDVDGGKMYSFTIEIQKSYKEEIFEGRERRTVMVGRGNCDFLFDVDKEYLFYIKEEFNTLNCSICSRTSLLVTVDKNELIVLDKLYNQYIKHRRYLRPISLWNNCKYEIDLVKNSFEESMERKNLIIYILSGICIVLFLLIVIIILRKK